MLAGTLFVALLYLFSSTSVSLILSPGRPNDRSPLTPTHLTRNWGEAAALLAAVAIAISALGALNNNLLVAGELGYSMAFRGTCPPASPARAAPIPR
jgi:APA family basic amino acid/polyamine antiporter